MLPFFPPIGDVPYCRYTCLNFFLSYWNSSNDLCHKGVATMFMCSYLCISYSAKLSMAMYVYICMFIIIFCCNFKVSCGLIMPMPFQQLHVLKNKQDICLQENKIFIDLKTFYRSMAIVSFSMAFN